MKPPPARPNPPPPKRSGTPPGPPRPPSPRAEATFISALDHAPEEREAFVAGACAGDGVLGAEVRAMLALHRKAGDFLEETPVTPEIKAELARLKPEEGGEMIGPYKLREQIGEGGFGTVWVADQEKPVRRRVALKIIKLGMDTKEVIARFEQERQALAMMDHPNIAKVLDAGTTAAGRPYFVMELVRGVKITNYCDDQQLSTRERIELFVTVCQAVQHAHQKGIIHRDIKPSNILVTINDGKAVVKVIDFGVAKATQGQLGEHTVYTEFQQMIGTPLYMSPEQAEMTSMDIDTRSDIYSLGVLLYELLTGHTPIEKATLARVGMDEIRRIIRETDPPLPSLRMKTLDRVEMTTAAKRRHTEPAKLSGALRGDLDWIVMKCIEKDRARRYDTANGLALDLQRHLNNEVVIARPPTTAYLLGKLIKRNKSVVAAGCTVALALVVGFAAAVWQARRANREAERSAAALRELRESAPAFAEQARALTANEKFDEAISKFEYAIKLRPDVADYLVAKGDLLQCQFKLVEAATIYREALRVKPGLARAEASAKLCDELLAAPLSSQGTLSRESLAKLHLAMQVQQRPAAEVMPVARLLGEEKNLLLKYWLERFKDLPVSGTKPLKERLTVREDGLMALDLSDTTVVDLSPLVGAPLAELDLSSSRVYLNSGRSPVADLAPLRNIPALEKLEISGSTVTDLSPLAGLRLKSLALNNCLVRDLSPIRNMPLEELGLGGTRVEDLSPLVGMPIREIELAAVPVQDFSPLAQLPLEKCSLLRTRITDLSVLRGRPLKQLVLWSALEARNYAVLSEITTLEILLLPGEFRQLPESEYQAIGNLRTHPGLRQIAGDVMAGMAVTNISSKEIFWRAWDSEQFFVPALRGAGIRFFLSKRSDGSNSLYLPRQPLKDLSILKDAQISELILEFCPVSDLAPLRNLNLDRLQVISESVASLEPLRGMLLTSLYLHSSLITDLSPLKGMHLRELFVDNCRNVTDFSTVAELSALENLTVPVQAGNFDVLRKLTGLKRLAFTRTSENLVPITTKEEFWKEYDESPWIKRVSGIARQAKTMARLSDGTWQIDFGGVKALTDLRLLQGARISRLNISKTGVSDLGPIRGMPLRTLELDATAVADILPLSDPALGGGLQYLDIGSCPITDFSPLAACSNLTILRAYSTGFSDLSLLRSKELRELWVAHTPISDLSPLAGLPLEAVYLDDIKATDVTPLAKCPTLKTIILPPKALDLDALRTLPALERLSYDYNKGSPISAAEFWTTTGGAEKALPFLEAAARKSPDSILRLRVAALHAWFGKSAVHASLCAEAIEAAEQQAVGGEISERAVKSWCLMPLPDTAMQKRALALARKTAADTNSKPGLHVWCMHTLGMAEFRAGNGKEAEAAFLQAEELAENLGSNRPVIQVPSRLFRAMILARAGKTEDAKMLFRQAEAQMPPLPENADRLLPAGISHDQIVCWLVWREACALFPELDAPAK